MVGCNVDILRHKRILIIEDDTDLLEFMGHVFLREEAKVYTATNGPEGLRQFYTYRPDLVLLDLMLPGTSGQEVCRQIRQLSDVPLIIISALTRSEDIIQGLACGADDYITKPFRPRVLIAHVQALLRRAMHPYSNEEPNTYYDDYVKIDLDKHRVRVRDHEVKLSTKEFGLLSYLLKNAGRVLTFQQILEGVWGWEYQDNVEYVHAYIWRLRQKLEEDPHNPVYILTEHGIGYRFVKRPLD